MADDWQAGDLALCVKVGTWYDQAGAPELDAPKPGHFYRVDWVTSDETATYLIFDAWPFCFWHAPKFRKIRPHTPDAEDLRTIAMLGTAPVPEVVG